jgi:hypothetical protein
MKVKKALKRLRRVEELLSVVIDEFVGNEPRVREFLDSAKKSVIRAKAGINSQSNPGVAKKQQRKAKENKRSDRTAVARKVVAKNSSERKIKSREETRATKRGFSTPPTTEPPERPLTHEASPDPNQGRQPN